MNSHAILAGIYAIVDRDTTEDPLVLLDAILSGGIRLVQYRAKSGVAREIVRAMHARTRACGALLLVNDDLDAALDADGVHLGQEDLCGRDVVALRARLIGRIFGVSCGTAVEARAAQAAGADYVGTGPFAVTPSKGDAGPAIGAHGIATVVRTVGVPVAAIGGIDLDNLAEVRASGARMAAIISAIARSPDPEGASRALVAGWATPPA